MVAINVIASRTIAERPKRWDRPFGPEMSEADVELVLEQPLFSGIDPDRFSANLPFREIIRNDTRVRAFGGGDVIVREGDYGGSMFTIVSGRVRVVLDHTTDEELGRRTGGGRRGLFQALRQLWANPDQPEVRDIASYFQAGPHLHLRGEGEQARTYLDDIEAFLAKHETNVLDAGESFGEIAALARSPRTATVIAEADTIVVELRWQGVRDIRRRDAGFREHIDSRYRARSLIQHLNESPLFAHIDDATLRSLSREIHFETYGTFEWFLDFKQIQHGEPGEVIRHEPVIAEEGHYLDGLIMIRSGFARISERLDSGHRTTGYATQNEVFGLDEIIANVRIGTELAFRRSLRAVGHVDILRVPTAIVEKYVLPKLLENRSSWRSAQSDQAAPAWQERSTDIGISQSLVDFLVDNRTINGTATMLIDSDRCTACDDCVRACAATHNNNPRFRRHGPIHGNLQVTNACMHCVDPVCLIGCPTGAIHRHPTGPVVIDDATCIGCGTCATSCPYDNISLVEIRDADGAFVVDSVSRQPIVKATKCDLCFDQLGGPACQRACPHDALIRLNMQRPRSLAERVNRK